MFKRVFILALVLVAALAFGGCVKNYTVLLPLEQPIQQHAAIRVGDISDQLPLDTPEEKKPTLEDIEKFKSVLFQHLVNSEVFTYPDSTAEGQLYEIRGSILEYKKGSGFMRFMFGFGVGSAKVATHLELVNTGTNAVVFSGDFSGNVSSWAESGNAMYERVAKDFAKQIKKQSEKLEPKEKS